MTTTYLGLTFRPYQIGLRAAWAVEVRDEDGAVSRALPTFATLAEAQRYAERMTAQEASR